MRKVSKLFLILMLAVFLVGFIVTTGFADAAAEKSDPKVSDQKADIEPAKDLETPSRVFLKGEAVDLPDIVLPGMMIPGSKKWANPPKDTGDRSALERPQHKTVVTRNLEDSNSVSITVYPPTKPGQVVVRDLEPEEVPRERFYRERGHEGYHPPINDRGRDTDEGLQKGDPTKPSANLLGANEWSRAQIAPGAPAVAIDGIHNSGTGGVPFDVDLGVGDNYIWHGINTEFIVYDKNGTQQAASTYRAFFNNAATPNCGAFENSSNFLADPQVVYDDENNRWVTVILRIDANSDDSWLCYAASQTSDPTGTWNLWETGTINAVADYPHLGIGEDAIFVGTNSFAPSFTGAHIYAMNKNALYTGGAVSLTDANLGTSVFTPQPAERRGFDQSQYPPASSPHYFVLEGNSDGDMEIWRWDFPTSGNAPAFWADFPGGDYAGNPVDITGTTITQGACDGGDSRALDAELRWPYLWYVRGAASVSNGTIDWGGANVSGVSPSAFHSGEWQPALGNGWWPDCTVDTDHNFVVGFTGANNTGPIYPGAYVTGRDASTPANQLENEVVSKLGEVQYDSWEASTPWRWGDYAGVAVDPNGCDVWAAGEYTDAGGLPYRRTYIQKFRFGTCSVSSCSAFLDSSQYACSDSINGTIVDPVSAPTNMFWNSTTGGAVPASIGSSTPPSYFLTPVTNIDIGAVSGDEIWISYDCSDSSTYESLRADLICDYSLCVYTVEPLDGGCDDDKYLDKGEVLNISVGISNEEAFNLPLGFYADLTTTNPDVEIINATAGPYPQLDSGYYGTPAIPFTVRYTGDLGTACLDTVDFSVTNIRATDDSWNGICPTPGGNDFSVTSNGDPAVTPILDEDFDGGVWPPVGWSISDAFNLPFQAGSTSTNFAGLFGGSEFAICDPITLGATTGYGTLVSPSFDLTGTTTATLEFSHDIEDYYGGTIAYVEIDPGTGWENVATYDNTGGCVGGGGYCCLIDNGDKQYFLDTWTGNANVEIRFRYTTNLMNCFWGIDDIVVSIPECEDTDCTTLAPVLAYDHWGIDDSACGDDGVLDPGEVGGLRVYLYNSGDDYAHNAQGTLTCQGGPCPAGISICESNATWDTIPFGVFYTFSADPTFQIAIDSSVACGTTFDLTLTLNSWDNSSGTSYGPQVENFSILVGDTQTESVLQQTDPITGSSSTVTSDFTPALATLGGEAVDARLYYTLGYIPAGGTPTSDLGPMDFGVTGSCELTNFTSWNGGSVESWGVYDSITIACSGACAMGIQWPSDAAHNDWAVYPVGTGIAMTTGVTYTLEFTHQNYDAAYTENLWVYVTDTDDPATWTQTLIWGADGLDNDTCVTRGGEFTVPSNGNYWLSFHTTTIPPQGYYLTVDDVHVFHISGGTGTVTDNVKIDIRESSGTWFPIKGFGDPPPATPFDITALYQAQGPGTWEIQVQENAGGVAELSSSQIQVDDIVCGSAGACTGLCPFSVDVTPNLETVCTGNTIQFTASVLGGVPGYSYQWYEDGSPVGVDSPTYTTTAYGTAQSHTYNVVVTDSNTNTTTDSVDSNGNWIDCVPNVIYVGYESVTELQGNGDAFIEPGEEWQVTIRLENNGQLTAGSVAATLALNGASVESATITGNPGAFGDIASSAQATDTFAFCVDNVATCGGLTFDVTGITWTGGGSPPNNQIPAFSLTMGETLPGIDEWADLTPTDPITAAAGGNTISNLDATTVTSAVTATLDYTFTYTPLAGGDEVVDTADFTAAKTSTTSRDLTPDTTSATTTLAMFTYTCATRAANCTAAALYFGGANVALPLPSGNGIPVNTDVTAFYNANGPGTYQFRITNSGNQGITVQNVSLTITTPGAGTDWTANARVEYWDGSTWQMLKDYAAADTGSYDILALGYYNGPDTYQIRLTEGGTGGGGTAELDTTAGTDGLNVTQAGATICDASAFCGGVVAPGEAAPGDGGAGTALTWSTASKTQLEWPTLTGATDYYLYRGDQADLAGLTDGNADFCERHSTAILNTGAILSEDPTVSCATADCCYYLILGWNAAGFGDPGHGRTLNDTGACP